MQYIIMDLEWNSAYSRKKQGFINEIIEIGAVKLDVQFQKIDTFSILVKPSVSKRLQGRVKALTHLSNEDVQDGVPYATAMQQFSAWVGDAENVFLTWGDGDIRAMLQNNMFFLQIETLPFMQNYVDIQSYCQQRLQLSKTQQVGLSDAAEKMGLDPNTYAHHRALDDSLLTADCFKTVYDAETFAGFLRPCNADFYARLTFKPYFLRDMHDASIPKGTFDCVCDVCGGKLKKEKNWRAQNHAFFGVFYCKKCNRHIRYTVRCKQLYDRLDIRKSCKEVLPKSKEEEKGKNSSKP